MADKQLSPIVLFVYNRPWHTKQTVEALQKNKLADESDLFIFADGPKKNEDLAVGEVRKYIKKVDGFKSVIIKENDFNAGLANSVISGVSEIISQYGKVIVLEDDIVTSVNFLSYMNSALDMYYKDSRISSISGYVPSIVIPQEYELPVFIGYRNSSWGWGTWKNIWNEVDWEVSYWQGMKKQSPRWKKLELAGEDIPYVLKLQMGNKINSWAIRFLASQIQFDRFTLFPTKTLVSNIGMDGTGVHCGKVSKGNYLNVNIVENSLNVLLPEMINYNENIGKKFQSLFKYGYLDIVRRYIKDLVGRSNG